MADYAVTTYYYPNASARIIWLAMEGVVGREGILAVRNTSGQTEKVFPNGRISSLVFAQEEMHGALGGRGLAIRAGRACFKLGKEPFD